MESTKSILQILQEYWIIITFVVGMIVTWTLLNTKVNSNSEEIKQLRTDLSLMQKEFNVLNQKYIADITEIKSAIIYIKEKLQTLI